MANPKRILVTGGSGFIGSNFLQRFVPAHPEIQFLNLDRLTYAANPLSLSGVAELPNYRFALADIANYDQVATALQGFEPDWIVHFAAESHVDRSILGPGEFVQSNIVGTFNLLEVCRSLWKGKEDKLFHHVSTDEVYGSLGESGAFTETSRYDPSSPYSASKAASDHLVHAYSHTFGLPVTITNCSNNYGPRQFPEKLIPLMILNAVDGKPLPVYGQGLNVRDWLYVTDHCEAIWEVMHRGKRGETYNVGGNCELRNIDLVRTLCRVVAEQLGRPHAELESLITYVPDRPGHDLRYAIDASKIRSEIGWEPRIRFESALSETVRWYLENPDWVEQARMQMANKGTARPQDAHLTK